MALAVFRSFGQVFCRMSLNWDFPGILFLIRLRLWVFGGRSKVPFSSMHSTRLLTLEGDLDSMAEVVLAGSPDSEVPFPPFPPWNCTLCEGVSHCPDTAHT